MPYKSKAQQKLFHYLESKGEMPKKTVEHYDEMTDFADLPEHIKHAMGGIISEIQSSDLLEHPKDTSGEPEDDHMDHSAEGGMVKEKKGMFAKRLAEKLRGY